MPDLRSRASSLLSLLTHADDGVAGARLFVIAASGAMVLLTAWAAIGKLEVVSAAGGEVVPSTQVKSVQHLEGGIVAEILVQAGQRVRRDQPLVELEATAKGSEVGELSSRQTSLRIDLARLEAERAGQTEISFAPDLQREHAETISQARALFQSRRQKRDADIRSLEEAVAQRGQAINEVGARIRNSRQALSLLQEQIAISDELLKNQLSNRMNHLALMKEASATRSRIEEDTASLQRLESSLKEAQGQLSSNRHGRAEEVEREMAGVRREMDELVERLKKFSDSLRRTTLRAPVDGTVKEVFVATRGGVVQPGKTVVDIVPEGDRLVVEAKLPIYDIGYVHAGQVALIRLASSDGPRFGAISGVVSTVSPDSFVTDKGAYYKVRIETSTDRFRNGLLEYRLVPGIQVTTSIIIGQRSVLQYLLDPLVGRFGEAFRER
ncbi:MAG: HlyD family type I secretion periplasmic adaptor subunit [Magnetospirillum sp.]|nr:HlyD family type I secretion periplasmic adaptor subunit [Magnetospirillum sp.]